MDYPQDPDCFGRGDLEEDNGCTQWDAVDVFDEGGSYLVPLSEDLHAPSRRRM